MTHISNDATGCDKVHVDNGDRHRIKRNSYHDGCDLQRDDIQQVIKGKDHGYGDTSYRNIVGCDNVDNGDDIAHRDLSKKNSGHGGKHGNHINKMIVVNLSSLKLDAFSLNILEKGLNLSIVPRRIPFKDLICNIDSVSET